MTEQALSEGPFHPGTDERREVVEDANFRRVSQIDGLTELLQKQSLFRDADHSQVVAAIGDSDVLLLQPGETLLTPGSQNDTVFLLLSGGLTAHLDSGSPIEAAISIQPGECVGELSAIDGRPVSALVKAAADSLVLRLPANLFWDRLMVIPNVARNLLVVLADRMRRGSTAIIAAQRKQIELDYLLQELDVARKLQTGMLPMRSPMFPERSDVEVAGMMEAASAVGGDLFDAFFVDEQRLFICIGDVSGHGIPAALFMARAVSLMRIAAISIADPATLLERINDQLCSGNDANMFITLFCGFLEIDTGRLVYSNGGHLAPVLWRKGRSGELALPKGTAIGVIPGIGYLRDEAILDEGDILLCFTDGVTEAHAPSGEEFSESRLMSLVEGNSPRALETILGEIRKHVAEFSDHRELADDCTMLAIRRRRQRQRRTDAQAGLTIRPEAFSRAATPPPPAAES